MARWRVTRGLALAGVFLAAGLSAASLLAVGAQTAVLHKPFVIVTGSTGGTYFPIGEAIAAIVSHPPGVSRCEKSGVCGPAGLIASVRTSEGTIANILAVNSGTADAGFAQSDIVREAVAGRGAFRKAGKQTHIRLLASLFPEELQLIATKSSRIRSVADLAGKRVAIGSDGSGTNETVRSVLSAYGVRLARIKANGDSPDTAAVRFSKGELDALFFIGGAPVPFIRDLLATGKATLVPVAGAGRDRVLHQVKGLTAATIPAGLYPGTGKTETVALRAVLILRDTASNAVVYGVTQALFNPANRGMLAGSHRSADFIRIDDAPRDPPAPIHPGAAPFFAGLSRLPKSVDTSAAR